MQKRCISRLIRASAIPIHTSNSVLQDLIFSNGPNSSQTLCKLKRLDHSSSTDIQNTLVRMIRADLRLSTKAYFSIGMTQMTETLVSTSRMIPKWAVLTSGRTNGRAAISHKRGRTKRWTEAMDRRTPIAIEASNGVANCNEQFRNQSQTTFPNTPGSFGLQEV